jgi:cytochrome c oxidase assembly protein subunit 15
MADFSYKPVIIWLSAGCIMIYLMVVIGGMTRLTHSGLSMVEWSPTGSLPPMNEAQWNIQFEKYKQSPEYILLNTDYTLDDFKSIFWWEYSHRLIGRLIGFVFLLPFFWFLVRKKFPPGFGKKAVILLALGGLQGLLGWYMVKSGLVKNPHVSHYRLAAHLITAFITFGFTFWFMLDLMYPVKENNSARKLKSTAITLLLVVILQIIYGAFMAGLRAGYGYSTFPKMGDQWVPDEITILEPAWINFFEGQAGVQFVHRYIAYLVVILVLFIYFRSRRIELHALQKRLINGLLIIVTLQFLLGVFTLLYHVPVSIAVLHQTGAFFLFSTTIFLIHRLR